MTRQPLTQRQVDPDRQLPVAQAAVFRPLGYTPSPEDVAPDMRSLAERIRSVAAFQRGEEAVFPLGGHLFDAVITASGHAAYGVVAALDKVQRARGDGLDSCGPVIEDPSLGWLIWLVPPGASEVWQPHPFAVCLGRPRKLTLPPLAERRPREAFWLRRLRGDRLVPPAPLRDLLDRYQPGPVPHMQVLASRFGIS